MIGVLEIMKIAILIQAYKLQNQVNRLVEHLAKDFDIYIHIDKKSDLEIKKIDNVFVFKEYEVYWGHESQIDATCFLMKEAHKNNYDRYIILSGQDLPLISNKELIKFYEKNNYENIGVYPLPEMWEKELNSGFGRIDSSYTLNNEYELILVGQPGYRPIDYSFYGGSEYCDLSNKCLTAILSYLSLHPEYRKRFNKTRIGIEIFFQTLIKILKFDKLNESQHFLEWDEYGHPKIFKFSDFNRLIRSNKLFARKFDETIDNKIIDKIYSYLENEEPKIAMLMLVHKNENQANRLISHLAKDFDVYVHVDKKSDIRIKPQNNVFIYTKYKVYWGDFSVVQAEIFLLKEASKNYYKRYVLLSGQCLPLKSNKEIISIYENTRDHIYFFNLPSNKWNGGLNKVQGWWYLHLYKTKLSKEDFNKYLKARPLDYKFYGGSQWFDFLDKTVITLLDYIEKHPEYSERFHYTLTSDEMFFQTLINLLEIEVENYDLRWVNWGNSSGPYNFKINDYDKLIKSDCLFARKFDETIDNKIINLIYEYIEE
jgi:hypothetical protein